MNGPVKHYNSHHDVLVGLEVHPEVTKAWLKDQYDNRFLWYTVKPSLYKAGDTYTEIVDGEPVEKTYEIDEPWEESETSKVVEMTDEEGNVISRSGLQYIVDPNAYVTSRLNFTWEEIESIIGE